MELLAYAAGLAAHQSQAGIRVATPTSHPPKTGVKTFWQWLVDKYGPEEAARRYNSWRNALKFLESTDKINRLDSFMQNQETRRR